MALLTVAEVRAHVESDLDDDAFGRLIDDADAEIIARLGALASSVEVHKGGTERIWPHRKVSSITSIVERIDEQNTTLVATDYALDSDSRALERLQGGSNPRSEWAPQVTVTYVPVDETARRKRLLVDLVKLANRYAGVRGEGVGPVRAEYGDYEAERNALFRSLSVVNRGLVV